MGVRVLCRREAASEVRRAGGQEAHSRGATLAERRLGKKGEKGSDKTSPPISDRVKERGLEWAGACWAAGHARLAFGRSAVGLGSGVR